MLPHALRIMGIRHRVILCGILALWSCDRKADNSASSVRNDAAQAQPNQDALQGNLVLDSAASALDMTMKAELENIQGKALQGLAGTLNLDAEDITKSRGSVSFDLFELALLHAIKRGDTGEFGDFRESSKQNDDMRIWLEIGADTPAALLEKYRYASFSIDEITLAEPRKLPPQAGSFPVKIAASGTFSLHGRDAKKNIELQVTVKRNAHEVNEVLVRTLAPLKISLSEHEVRPRTAFGVLADRTLEAMGKKVAKTPEIQLNLKFVSLSNTN